MTRTAFSRLHCAINFSRIGRVTFDLSVKDVVPQLVFEFPDPGLKGFDGHRDIVVKEHWMEMPGLVVLLGEPQKKSTRRVL
jgi:hypothetical protein